MPGRQLNCAILLFGETWPPRLQIDSPGRPKGLGGFLYRGIDKKTIQIQIPRDRKTE